MKKNISFILLIIQLISFDLYCQNRGKWIDISPFPAHDVANGNGFLFFNKDTGFVYTQEKISGSYTYCLMQTNDGGNTWFRKKIFTAHIYNVKFYNKDLGFYKYGKNVYKITNGGDSFEIIKTFPNNILGSLFLSKNSIFVATNENSSHPDSLKTYIGKNNGKIWKICYDTQISTIQFVDSLNGYGLYYKEPYLLKSTDGGEKWNKVNKLPDIGQTLKFTTIDTGYFITHRKIYRTINGGQTWDTIMNGIHNTSCYDITCINSKTCFSVGYNLINATPEIYKTTNAGQSWQSLSEEVHFTISLMMIEHTQDSSQNVTLFVSKVDGQRTPLFKGTFEPWEIWNNIKTPQKTVSEFKLYPNPSSGYINADLKFDEVEDVQIIVTDLLGKEIQNLKMTSFKEGTIPIDMSNYSGIFFCSIKTEKGFLSRRIIITK